jgi:hypothetical protein
LPASPLASDLKNEQKYNVTLYLLRDDLWEETDKVGFRTDKKGLSGLGWMTIL